MGKELIYSCSLKTRTLRDFEKKACYSMNSILSKDGEFKRSSKRPSFKRKQPWEKIPKYLEEQFDESASGKLIDKIFKNK